MNRILALLTVQLVVVIGGCSSNKTKPETAEHPAQDEATPEPITVDVVDPSGQNHRLEIEPWKLEPLDMSNPRHRRIQEFQNTLDAQGKREVGSNQKLANEVASAISECGANHRNLSIETEDGHVTVGGMVPTEEDRELILLTVNRHEAVVSVDDRLTVVPE